MSKQFNEEEIRVALDEIERRINALPRMHAEEEAKCISLTETIRIIVKAHERLGLPMSDELMAELKEWQELGRESMEMFPFDSGKDDHGSRA